MFFDIGREEYLPVHSLFLVAYTAKEESRVLGLGHVRKVPSTLRTLHNAVVAGVRICLVELA